MSTNIVAIGDFIADSRTDDFRVTAKLTGWTDAAPIRNALADKAQSDGAWDASGYFSARVVGIDGVVDQPTALEAAQVADSLTALRPRGKYQLLVDNSELGVRTTQVFVTQGAVIEWVDDTTFRYSVQVTAPDPTKYGADVFLSTTLAATGGGTGLVYPLAYPLDYGVAPGVTPGAIAVPNSGTTSYHPRLRIDGPVPNPVLTMAETGASLRYGGTVAAGQWLDIDLANRRVLLNGLVSHRHLVTFTGDWLSVPAGGGSLSWTADAADPAASLSVFAYEGAWS